MILYLTNEGKKLLQKVQSNLATIKFTKMQIGDGAQSATNIEDVSALTSPLKDLPIVDVKVLNNTVNVKGLIDNTTYETPISYSEIGLFATDGTKEILYIYSNRGSNKVYIPTPNIEIVRTQLNIPIGISNTENVVVEVSKKATASSTSFDNEGTSLESVDVQSAIVESMEVFDNKIEDIKSGDVTAGNAKKLDGYTVEGLLDVSKIEDTGWLVPSSYKSPFTTVTGSNYLRYRKIGKQVALVGAVKNTASDSRTGAIFTLDEAFRPICSVISLCTTSSGGTPIVEVTEDGTVKFTNLVSPNVSVSISLIYFVKD